ncbi:hypothetical protein RIF29_38639 [Crotalaria pallida]|uniref:Uncharacterized protein n=1 Tax=Crotalaria pallida TaxID=3830 RepID=A0AAN9HPX1_CROPI
MSKQTLSSPKLVSVPLDLSLVQDCLLNFEGFDDLSVKQASDLLKSLDLFKEKLKGKQIETVDDDVDDITGYHMYRFTSKLRKVRQALSKLNREKFCSIDKKELVLRDQLDDIQRKLHDDPTNSDFQRLDTEMNRVLKNAWNVSSEEIAMGSVLSVEHQ